MPSIDASFFGVAEHVFVTPRVRSSDSSNVPSVHELTYAMEGSCSRGESCKFSHERPSLSMLLGLSASVQACARSYEAMPEEGVEDQEEARTPSDDSRPAS